jgi:hypothetical protein
MGRLRLVLLILISTVAAAQSSMTDFPLVCDTEVGSHQATIDHDGRVGNPLYQNGGPARRTWR